MKMKVKVEPEELVWLQKE